MARKQDLKQRKSYVYTYGFEHELISKMVNSFMVHGKKAVAEKIVLTAIERAKETLKVNGKILFNTIIENLILMTELTKKRFGGTTYMVPNSIRIDRAEKQVIKSLRDIARSLRKKDSTQEILYQLLVDTFQKKGAAIKAKEDKWALILQNNVFAHLGRSKKSSIQKQVEADKVSNDEKKPEILNETVINESQNSNEVQVQSVEQQNNNN